MESMGVVNVQEAGDLWVWLECIGVVRGCCKEVNRFPHNNFYYYLSLLHLY